MATKKHYSKKSRNTRRKSSKNKKTQKKQKGAGGKTVIPLNKVESQYRKMINLIKKDVALFSKSDEFLNKYFPNSKNSNDRNVIRQEGLVALAKIEQKFKTLMKVYASPSAIQSGSGGNNNDFEYIGPMRKVNNKETNKQLLGAFFIFMCIVFRMEGEIGIISSVSGVTNYLINMPNNTLPLFILATSSYLISYGGIKGAERLMKTVILVKQKLLKDMEHQFDVLNNRVENSENMFDSLGRIVVLITNKSLVIARSGKDIVVEKYKTYKQLKDKEAIRNATHKMKFSFNNSNNSNN